MSTHNISVYEEIYKQNYSLIIITLLLLRPVRRKHVLRVSDLKLKKRLVQPINLRDVDIEP